MRDQFKRSDLCRDKKPSNYKPSLSQKHTRRFTPFKPSTTPPPVRQKIHHTLVTYLFNNHIFFSQAKPPKYLPEPFSFKMLIPTCILIATTQQGQKNKKFAFI